MGNGRGGLYSYDFLDRLFGFLDGPSAERILPEYQHLEAGDVIPLGAGKPFPVQYVDAPHALVLAGAEDDVRWTWQFGLYEQPGWKHPTHLAQPRLSPGHHCELHSDPSRSARLHHDGQMLRNLRTRAERHAGRAKNPAA